MARYRPVDVRLWNDRRFLSLPDDLKLLWAFFLTTPSTLPIPGVIVGGPGALAEQLGWTPERFTEGLAELVRRGMKVRSEGRVIWLLNALKYQPPESPNALRGWAKCWDDIPEGDLKTKIWDALRIACKSKGAKRLKLFMEAFPKVWGEGYAQPSLDLSIPGSGSGSGSETGSRSLPNANEPTEPEPLRDLSPEASPPEVQKPTLRVVGPVDELVAEFTVLHVEAFERVRKALHSDVLPLEAADVRSQLRKLVEGFPSLEGARERLAYALRIQAEDAVCQTTTMHFGPQLWKPTTFAHSLTLTSADVRRKNGKAVPVPAPKRPVPAQQTLLTDPKDCVKTLTDMDDDAIAIAETLGYIAKETGDRTQ
jgi:hypothetical protein